ncbi:MAG: alkaline phosphatase family protein [Thiobacillus sp.]
MGEKLKLLVIGIDGADRRVVEGMPMPFLQGLLKDGAHYSAKVDLWSRGWAEIFTGRHGVDTGAFYNRPACTGKYEFTQHFNLSSLNGNPAVRPIWNDLNEKGFRVGVMNIPTTLPAPAVDGFFVSGVGGGSDKSGSRSIPAEACYPPSIMTMLEDLGYVLDVRRGASGIDNLEDFFRSINDMEEKRTASFVQLATQYAIDFGFVGYMGLSRVCYLLMADILNLIGKSNRVDTENDRRILDFFSRQDQLLRDLVQQLSPERVLIVSDHGMAPYTHQVNLNAFLVEGGWQKKNESMNGWIRGAGKAVKNMLPVRFRRNLGKKMPGVRQFVGQQNYATQGTAAIATGYISGIYLNDARFGGTVSPRESEKLVSEIVGAFNEYAPAKNNGMHASVYALRHRGCHAEAYFPDIWIDHPDTIFFNDHGPFIAPNRQYKPFDSFANVVSDMNSGIKGVEPLLCLVGEGRETLNVQDTGSLTQAYRIIQQCMVQRPKDNQ